MEVIPRRAIIEVENVEFSNRVWRVLGEHSKSDVTTIRTVPPLLRRLIFLPIVVKIDGIVIAHTTKDDNAFFAKQSHRLAWRLLVVLK